MRRSPAPRPHRVVGADHGTRGHPAAAVRGRVRRPWTGLKNAALTAFSAARDRGARRRPPEPPAGRWTTTRTSRTTLPRSSRASDAGSVTATQPRLERVVERRALPTLPTRSASARIRSAAPRAPPRPTTASTSSVRCRATRPPAATSSPRISTIAIQTAKIRRERRRASAVVRPPRAGPHAADPAARVPARGALRGRHRVLVVRRLVRAGPGPAAPAPALRPAPGAPPRQDAGVGRPGVGVARGGAGDEVVQLRRHARDPSADGAGTSP